MEERCSACEVYGGNDSACMGEGERAAYEQEHEGKRPCPRVLLDRDNVEAWALLGYAMNESIGRLLATPAGELLVEDLLGGMSREEATDVARRTASVLQDGRLWKAVYPDPKKPEAKRA